MNNVQREAIRLYVFQRIWIRFIAREVIRRRARTLELLKKWGD